MDTKVTYKILDRISYNVDEEYDIVFDLCVPVHNGKKQNYEQLQMRYLKDGKVVQKPPAFDEKEMVRAIVKLYESDLLSPAARDILRHGIR